MTQVATGRWFSPDTLVSSTNKTDHHDTTERLLKMLLNTRSHQPQLHLYLQMLFAQGLIQHCYTVYKYNYVGNV